MSCCPSVPPATPLGGTLAQAAGPESDLRAGESVECYMVRAGNVTGLQDDATGNVLNRIENTSVPILRTATTASVNTQLRLTAGSTRTPTSWSADSVPPGLTLTGGGLLSGTFSSPGTVYAMAVTASDGLGAIDTRRFTLAPSVGSSGTEIRLISPLPGGVVNSRFGPRLHPIQNVMKPHTGIDMKRPDRSVTDVVAAADGEVTLAGGDPAAGYGRRVWVRHRTSTGDVLCTTTYNHLAQVYVVVGQRVMAGQKLGLEGSTGASTGNHLHFECRLPDGKFIDPEPLINGALDVARRTLANGDPDLLETRLSTASLAEAEVRARQDSCAPFSPGYPAASPAETTDPTPTAPDPSVDPFELAWEFEMTVKVGAHWRSAPQFSPGDPELDAGLAATALQRRKTGYLNSPSFPGGETKFGIAQHLHPRRVVATMTYADARNTGYNDVWRSPKAPCHDKGALVGIMLFDISLLHGDGTAAQLYLDSGVTSTPLDSQGAQLADCLALHAARAAFALRVQRPELTALYLAQAQACLAYVQGLPPL